jgi:hypothetical protein
MISNKIKILAAFCKLNFGLAQILRTMAMLQIRAMHNLSTTGLKMKAKKIIKIHVRYGDNNETFTVGDSIEDNYIGSINRYSALGCYELYNNEDQLFLRINKRYVVAEWIDYR